MTDVWEGSRWISAADRGPRAPAPLLRREFAVRDGVVGATLYVAAGGIAHVTINGRRVSTDVLSPSFTNYDATVQYVAHDVGGLLRTGANAIGVELGRGFYAMSHANVWGWEAAPWHAEPALRAVLAVEHADGRIDRIGTDAAWTSHPGPTVRDDLYGGEVHDARRAHPGFDGPGFDDAAWRSAVEVDGPRGRLVPERHQPIRVTATLPPDEVRRIGDGEFLLTFPRIIAGWVALTVTGPAGTEIVLRHGEKLTADGLPDLTNNGRFDVEFQTDRFVLAGTGAPERWEPRFSYKGFRHVHVTGWPLQDVPPGAAVAAVVHTDAERISVFDCSEPLLVDIHEAVVATIENNLHGFPTDTPMFEKNGWTGDMTVGAELFLRNLDAAAVLSKWVRDIHDSRDGEGAPRLLAPSPGDWPDWGPAPPWHAAYVVVPWLLHLYTGDESAIAELFDGILAYVTLEFDRSQDGISTTSLGDWASPQADPLGGNPPEDLRVAATAYLFHMLTIARAVATRLGRSEAVTSLEEMIARVRDAFERTFLAAERDRFRGVDDDGYRQTHNVLALAFGLVPDPATAEAVAARLVDDIVARGGALNTGILGTKHLLPVLTDHGHVDVALDLALRTDYPSWGHMIRGGTGTVWEHWSRDARSLDHYFLGTIDDWLMACVAGLRISPTVGYRQLEFAPAVTHRLAWAEGGIRTPHGPAGLRWEASGDRIEIRSDVPQGCEAVLVVPAAYGGGRIPLQPGRTVVVRSATTGDAAPPTPRGAG